MADIKISQLPAATTPLAGTEVLPLVQSGETRKVTVATLRATAVTAVTGTAPVVSSGGLTPAISMAAANTSTNGYLTSTDWNTFNGKYSTGGALGTPSSGTATNLTGLPLTTGVTGTLPVANGGTGTTTPALVAGTNVTISGTWPNQTINSSGGGGSGTVTSVAATVPTFLSVTGSPITTSGTLAIAYSGTALPVLNGGTGTTTPALVAGTNVTITGTWPNQTINSGGGTGMVYPGAGIGNSTGTAWGTSYSTTGTGTVVALATSPTFVTPILGTPTSATLTNATGLPLTTGVTGVLPVANGGTGQTTAAAAITALTGSQTSAYYLRSNGTNATLSALSAADLTGTVAIATGGTGQTTAAAAITALTGTQTSAYYLRSNGTNSVLAALAAADVTGTLAVANGGTGVTTSTGTGSTVLSTSPTLVTPLLGTPTSGVATNLTGLPLSTGVTGTLPVANGGTGLTTLTAGYIPYGNGTSAFGNESNLSYDATNNRLGVVGTGYSPNITLSDASTVAWDTTLGQVATFTFVSSNRTMGAPSSLVSGAFYALAVIQNSGSNTLTWNSIFKWASGTAPTLSTAASAKDYFVFRSDGTNLYEQGRSQGVA